MNAAILNPVIAEPTGNAVQDKFNSDVADFLRTLVREGSPYVTQQNLLDWNLLAEYDSGLFSGQDKDFVAPPIITGLNASGGFGYVLVSWDTPVSVLITHVEIWRAAVDDLGQAVLVGTTSAAVFSDELGSITETQYYWARAVSRSGKKGPFNAVAGVSATPAIDPAYIAEQLIGELSESHLVSELNSRIDIIDVLGGPDGNGLVNWADVVQDAIFDPATGLNAVVASHTHSIDTTIPGELSAQAARVSALFSGASVDPADGITPNVMAADINTIGLAITDGTTGLTASATRIDTLFAAVGDYSAAVETIAEVVGTNNGEGLRAQFLVKTDVNGKVAGYGLWNDGGSSEFVISADKFAVSSPSIDSGASKFPFVIGTVNGSNAISMNANTFIQDLTVTNAKIHSLNAAKLYVNSGTFASLLVGEAHIQDAMINTVEASKIYASSGTLAEAFIGVADIGTLNLAGQAITIAESAEDTTPTLLDVTSSHLYYSLARSVTTANTLSTSVVAIKGFIRYFNSDSVSHTVSFTLYKDASSLYTRTLTVPPGQWTYPIMEFDVNPGNGTFTFKVATHQTDVPGAGTPTVSHYEIKLLIGAALR
jgi:hypothetical protein